MKRADFSNWKEISLEEISVPIEVNKSNISHDILKWNNSSMGLL